MECGVWSLKCGVVKREVRSGASHVTRETGTPLSKNACTHGLGWRMAHASSIDEKGLIYIYIYP